MLGDDRGATAVEYAILASLIGAVIVLAVTHVGRAVFGMFVDVLQSMIDYF
jgi:Flp pilus assembly pilin Flp